MVTTGKSDVLVVIPHWNGVAFLGESLASLQNQSIPSTIIVVDNGSTDGSQQMIRDDFPDVTLIELESNRGFAGGVNAGIRHALKNGAEYIVLFNNDAIAEKDWLEHLVAAAKKHPAAGIVTGKFLRKDGKEFDSTGDYYSSWGFSFPRGRDERDTGQYNNAEWVFGGTGGASLYRAEMLEQIGLFDEEFFAYYEDVDLSFRAQLAGWKVWYEPKAVSYHLIGGTSSKMGSFTRYHSIKNFYYLYAKNMPTALYWKYLPKFLLASIMVAANSIRRLQFDPLLKAYGRLIITFPATAAKRWRIQRTRTVSTAYIDSILYHPIPPTQKSLLRITKRLKGHL